MKTLLSISLVTLIFNITWCTRSIGASSYGFLIVVKTGLISNSVRKGLESCLNSDPFSNTAWRSLGYLHNHVLLNNWITLSDGLSVYSLLLAVYSPRSYVGISTILNQHMAGSIIVLLDRSTLFLIIVPPVCCCLIDFLYDLSGPHAHNLTVLVLQLS